MDLKGILPVLPTPYAIDGEVDPAAMRRVARFALSAGVNGVVYPGFGERSRRTVLEGARRNAAGGRRGSR